MTNCYFVYGEQETNPMPKHWSDNINSFSLINHNKFTVNLVTLESSGGVHRELFNYSKILWAQVMRFKLIYEQGGLYSDCDIKYYGRIPELKDCDYVFATETHGNVSDAFFFAKQGSDILQKALIKSTDWSYEAMTDKRKSASVLEFLNNAGVGMFSNLVKSETGFDFAYNKQVHMSEQEFNGSFQPENGVGILPFEALCRHSPRNWVGWHECNGTWRPKNKSEVDLSMSAELNFNVNE